MAELSLQSPFPHKHYFSSIWVCGSYGRKAKAICLDKHWSIWQKKCSKHFCSKLLCRGYTWWKEVIPLLWEITTSK